MNKSHAYTLADIFAHYRPPTTEPEHLARWKKASRKWLNS